MGRRSAGILMYKRNGTVLEVFLVHPGGPAWANKDEGAWSIPKGEYEEDEDPLTAAKREFLEETGFPIDNECTPLTPVKLKSGKMVTAWASPGDLDAATVRSNTFRMEWPARSGKWHIYPEVDRAGWFGVAEARSKLNPAQVALVDELITLLEDAEVGGEKREVSV